MTTAGQFRNRRTGQPVPANMPYHIHPDKGPMAGAVHNTDIPGGTQGHDYYDPMMRRGGKGASPKNERMKINNQNNNNPTGWHPWQQEQGPSFYNLYVKGDWEDYMGGPGGPGPGGRGRARRNYQRGGRVNRRMQAGGRANGRLDNKTKSQKIDNKGRKR